MVLGRRENRELVLLSLMLRTKGWAHGMCLVMNLYPQARSETISLLAADLSMLSENDAAEEVPFISTLSDLKGHRMT